jgi:CRP-like cAMP-binding protein
MSKRLQNLLLESLPPSADLQPIELAKNVSLFEPHKPREFIYFPLNSVVSFFGDTGQGGTIEVWAVGREGIAGISSILGGSDPFRGVVVVPGLAIKAKAETLRERFKDNEGFHDTVLSYYRQLLVQISHLGICNTSHPLEQRLARWLLAMQERAGTKDLKFTQDLIASMLGTRRATISVAAAALQSAGLISYTPGSITIRSRSGLKRIACECHKVFSNTLR